MKSEFVLAFNEIAETRNLPREIIMEALSAALVSAYRRDAGVGAGQHVEARVDETTGESSIWIEKEVVEEVTNEATEVALIHAHEWSADAQLGDTIMVDCTPKNFGRIAAQTAKQVILQRMREAERETQYQEYRERLGDLITGTVQSDSGGVITLGLGRTEAILPQSQQMPGERYRLHEKVRAYVMDVRRTSRGPQIVVSRTHRDMLRRLLEYEVPEIYNGTVEIKSIAREPGARSKVAVAALQEGADPVGACVGMRGVRIQSIVKELNNEKIDVIEWNSDQKVFISKALSPARVSSVFLDDDPDEGRTAIVVVPDDQLSLAIGREGQNARLGAKLTGWRIDIKSITEAAQDALIHLHEPGLADLARAVNDTTKQVEQILEKKASNRLIMPEDYTLMVEFTEQVENWRLKLREVDRAEQRALREAARARVPSPAYQHPLEDTDLPHRIYALLDGARYQTVGQLMEQIYLNPEKLLDIVGFGPVALREVEEFIRGVDFPDEMFEETEPEAEPGSLAEIQGVAQVATESAEESVEAVPIGELETSALEEEVAVEIGEADWDDEEEEARARRAELVAQMSVLGGAATDAPPVEESEALAPESVEEEEVEAVTAMQQARPGLDRLEDEESQLEWDVEHEDLFDYDGLTEAEAERLRRQRAKQRRRQLIYDEELGEVISKRRRKPGRKRGDWEDYLD